MMLDPLPSKSPFTAATPSQIVEIALLPTNTRKLLLPSRITGCECRLATYPRIIKVRLVADKCEGGAGYHARDDGLAQARHQLRVDLLLVAVAGVHRVDHERVLRLRQG